MPVLSAQQNDALRAAADRVDQYLRFHYRRGLDEYEIIETPGYWRMRVPCTRCPGAREHRHTAAFFDSVTRDRVSGRFLSPYRTWLELGGVAVP
jgi:hypothetical protein